MKECDRVIEIIRKYMRLDYMANGCPRIILDNNGLDAVARELYDARETYSK